MKLKDTLEKTTAFFRDRGLSSPRLDAELLLSHGLGVERIRLYIEFDRPLGEGDLARCRELVRRRAQGEPVAYLVGYKDFFGATFNVGEGVLVPRPETEHLVEEALDHAKNMDEPRIVDLGSGSGCVGISLLRRLPKARLLSMDFFAAAVDYTMANARKLGVEDRVTVIEGDAASGEDCDRALRAAGFAEADIIVANPPYIANNDPQVEAAVKKFEPAGALFAEDEGLKALTSWSRNWMPVLAANSLMAMEMGHQQGPAMLQHFAALGLRDVAVRKDLSDHDRIIRGVHHG